MEKMLVVDDDDALRGMIKMRLSDTYETIDTGNPVQALGLAGAQTPGDLARSHDAGLFWFRAVPELS